MSKSELRKIILHWYDAKDTQQTDDEFLVDWVHTLIEETLCGGSNWNDEIEFIVNNCNYKFKGVRIYKGKIKTSYMATIDIPKENGKTNQISCGTFQTIIEAIKARKEAENKWRNIMKAYLLEVGVLLTKEDKEFEVYSNVYDKKYGYYDEEQCYIKSKIESIKQARAYVEAGVENTYAIVSNTWLSNDFDFDEGCVEDETYNVEDVMYSVAKINGEIIENFLAQ